MQKVLSFFNSSKGYQEVKQAWLLDTCACALQWAPHKCTSDPVPPSPPTKVCVCMCVCFTYHLTGSWYPWNKRIVSEIASWGRKWRRIVGGWVSGEEMEGILCRTEIPSPSFRWKHLTVCMTPTHTSNQEKGRDERERESRGLSRGTEKEWLLLK